MSSSSSRDKEDEAPQNQENHIPNIEEVLNSEYENIFLNDSLTRFQKQSISNSDDETDENKNCIHENETKDRNNQDVVKSLNEPEENRESSEPPKRKSNYQIDQKYNEIISIPIDVFPSSNSKSYTMTNPDHRYRTFCEIVLVAHHPNYLRNISDFNFIKEIGKGGYGAVWLADDMRTGNQCAVKELYVEELKGKILTSFLREIHAMIVARGKFICPIIGYTIEPPYSIITKYMPNGDLYHAVHNLDKKKKIPKPRIYGTHLTIICMCIAHALRHIHRCGLIHRDIKPGNILLDSDGMPYLVDFGVSRLIHPDHRHSQFVGTVSHMAPEVISSTNYGTKADVFSYAILLYEVGEKRHAFHNANKHSKEVCQQILRGERPFFSADGIPTAMKNLITRCWAQKPADRPNFDQIFQIFCEGKTYFKGSNPRKIVKFAQKLIKEDESEIKIPPPLPRSTNMDISAVLNRLMRKLTQIGPLDKTLIEQQNREKKEAADTIVEKMIQKPTILEKIINSGNIGQIPIQTVETSNLSNDSKSDEDENEKDNNDNNQSPPKISFPKNILLNSDPPEPLPIFINESKDKEIAKNSNDPQFLEYIQFQLERINLSQFDILAQFIMPVISSPSNVTKEVIKILLKMANQNNNLLIKYNQYHIITSVMLTDENDPYENELFDLLALFFIKKPLLLGQMYTRIIAYFIKKRPEETICLFSRYVDNIESIMDPFPILDFLLSYARVYINIPSGALFINLFYYLISEFAEYKVQRFDSIKPIFTAFIRSKQKIVAYEAIKAICNLYDGSIKVNMKTLINYIRFGSKLSTFSSSGSIPSFYLNHDSISEMLLSSKSFSNLQDKRNTALMLLDEKLRDVSLSLIERLPEYPLSNMFVQEIGFLIDAFPIKVTNILLKFAHQSLECAQIIVRRTDLWMDPSRSGNASIVFNLFLEVFRYKELRNNLVESPEFPALMSTLLKDYNKSIMEALAIIFKRLNLTEQIVDALENIGFYNDLSIICSQYCKSSYKAEQMSHKVVHRNSGLELYSQQFLDQDQDNSILVKTSHKNIPPGLPKGGHHHHRSNEDDSSSHHSKDPSTSEEDSKSGHHKSSRPPHPRHHHSKTTNAPPAAIWSETKPNRSTLTETSDNNSSKNEHKNKSNNKNDNNNHNNNNDNNNNIIIDNDNNNANNNNNNHNEYKNDNNNNNNNNNDNYINNINTNNYNVKNSNKYDDRIDIGRNSSSTNLSHTDSDNNSKSDKYTIIYDNDNDSTSTTTTTTTLNGDASDSVNLSINCSAPSNAHSDECFDDGGNLRDSLDFVKDANSGLTNSSVELLKRNRKGSARVSSKKRNSAYSFDRSSVPNDQNGLNLRAIPVATMVIIEASSKVKYVPSFRLFVPLLLSQLPLQNEMTAAAIHTLTVLSFHQEMKPVLNKPVLVNYFSQLKQFKAQKKYAITFLFNLLKKTD